MATGFDYNRWLADLEGYLRTRRPDVKVADLDPNAMHQAFLANESPFIFGSKPQLPLRPRGAVPDSTPQVQPMAAPVMLAQGVPTQPVQMVVSGIPCKRCGFIVSAQSQFCPQCGTTFTFARPKASDAGVWGILGIVSAGIGFFMCQVLAPFFILVALIFGAFAYHKGAKGQAIATFIMCAFLLAFFIYTMGQVQAGLDQMKQGFPR